MRSFGPAEIAAARPTTVIRSRLPRALTRKTQKPFVVMERHALDEPSEDFGAAVGRRFHA
jgi:hypothetical protein